MMGIFRKLLVNEGAAATRHERHMQERSRVASLSEMLRDDSVIWVTSTGPTRQYLRFAAQSGSSEMMGNVTTYKTVSQVASGKLNDLLRDEQITFAERYWVGRELGYTPEEILRIHRDELHPVASLQDCVDSANASQVFLRARRLRGSPLQIRFKEQSPYTPMSASVYRDLVSDGNRYVLKATSEMFIA
ncbi:MAG: hypothetical protein ACOCWQ_01305 [Nanoarchaeota archaeon]